MQLIGALPDEDDEENPDEDCEDQPDLLVLDARRIDDVDFTGSRRCPTSPDGVDERQQPPWWW